MRIRFRGLVLVISITLSSISFCSESGVFSFRGKPIDPLCVEFQGDSSRFDPVDLKKCSEHPNYVIEGINNRMTDKGFIGFDYLIKGDDYTSHGSSYYKVLGVHQGNFILYAYYNGGGSGYFSSIALVKREGDVLQLIKEIAGGDRCNGGLTENIQFKNNQLIFEKYITPYDMLSLSGFLPKTVQAYDDLAACAACCIGEALFRYDFEKEELISISIQKLAKGDSEVDQGKYQSCFNKVLKNYRIKKKLAFSPAELKALTQEFNQTCLPHS